MAKMACYRRESGFQVLGQGKTESALYGQKKTPSKEGAEDG